MSVLERSQNFTDDDQLTTSGKVKFFTACAGFGAVAGVTLALVTTVPPQTVSVPPPVSTAGTLAPPTSVQSTTLRTPSSPADSPNAVASPRVILGEQVRKQQVSPTGMPLVAATTTPAPAATTPPTTTVPPIQPSTIPTTTGSPPEPGHP